MFVLLLTALIMSALDVIKLVSAPELSGAGAMTPMPRPSFWNRLVDCPPATGTRYNVTVYVITLIGHDPNICVPAGLVPVPSVSRGFDRVLNRIVLPSALHAT